MALTKKQQQHPRFMDFSEAVSDALVEVAGRFDVSQADLDDVRKAVDLAVDEAVSALLKAYAVKHSS